MSPAAASSARRQQAAWLLLIFAVAFALRALHLWMLRGTPLLEILVGDARSYDTWARRIAAGEWLGSEVFYQAPLYPYFLAVVHRAVGDSAAALRLVQAVVGAGSCVLLAGAAWRLFSRSVGIASGLLLAFYPPAIFADTTLQKSVLGLFFLSLALFCLGGVVDRGRPRQLGGLGLAVGALVLTRENALVFALVLLPWLALRPGPPGLRRWLAPALFLAGLAVVLLPVALRNLAVGGEFHLTTSQLGPNFYIGNNPSSDGSYTPLRQGRGDAKYEQQDATAIAEASLGRELAPGEVSAFFVGRAFEYIRSQPGDWIALMGRKLALAFNAVEVVDTVDLYTHAEASPVLRVTSRLLHFGVLAPLALLGVFVTWPERRRLLPLYLLFAAYLASLVAFYVFGRYRLPLVPILVPFAAAALVGLRGFVAATPPRQLAIAGIAVALAVCFCNWPVLDERYMRSVTHYNLGNELFARGQVGAAADQYREAIALHADNALANNNLGVALSEQGDPAGALRHYERALAIAPSYVDAWINRARALAEAGDAAGAAASYENGLRIDPSRADAYAELGQLYAETGATELAVGCLERALRIDPNRDDLRGPLAMARQRRGPGSPGSGPPALGATSACRPRP